MNTAKILFFSFLLLMLNKSVSAQCEESFQYKASPSEGTSLGKIEILLTEQQSLLNLTIKVYQVNNREIKEIKNFRRQGTGKTIIIDGLYPSYYFVKVEWNGACEKYIGDLNGILIENTNG